MNPIQGTGAWLTPPVPEMEMVNAMELAQRGSQDLDHFDGQPPDNTDSAKAGYVELASGVGTSEIRASDGPAVCWGTWKGVLPIAGIGAGDSGGAGIASSAFNILTDQLAGRSLTQYRVYLSAIPAVGQEMQVFIGVGDAEVAQVEPSDGWYLHIDDAAPAFWTLKHARAGARVTQVTNLAPVAGAWQTLAVIADSVEGTVEAFGADDGDLIVPIDAVVTPVNIQPAVGVSAIAAASSTLGERAAATNFWADYIQRVNRWRPIR